MLHDIKKILSVILSLYLAWSFLKVATAFAHSMGTLEFEKSRWTRAPFELQLSAGDSFFSSNNASQPNIDG